jgi:predicted SnoaL-like aldol condensation-catalyzing enzyme
VGIVTGLFALLTGCAVLLVGAMLPDLRPLPPAEAATGQRAAREFYAAQDEALATGDVRRLIAAVAPSFADHRPGSSMERGRQGLVAEVTALRGALPGVRLSAEALVVDGDRVLVYVSLHPAGAEGRPGATPPPRGASADTVDVVRVAGGVVAERWSVMAAPGSWPKAIVTPTTVPPWSSSRIATETAAGMVCGATHCS